MTLYRGTHTHPSARLTAQINLKLGGVNQVVRGLQDTPRLSDQTMVIGLDVSHPPPGTERPSIVAAVSTLNGMGTKFKGELMAQVNPRLGHSQEAILQGQSLFAKLLQAWKKHNKDRLPEQVMLFRDGVSEGEYMAVARSEIGQFQRACAQKEFGGGAYVPKITFIVGTKRHHVRFFARNQADTDKSGNLPAGTVIDTAVVHPYVFDFYLQSHAGLVGTCRPAHYIVLRDDVRFSSDDLERLINSLCYTFQRATSSVSQVPIAKYGKHMKAAHVCVATV